jgi:hypothetical protein
MLFFPFKNFVKFRYIVCYKYKKQILYSTYWTYKQIKGK